MDINAEKVGKLDNTDPNLLILTIPITFELAANEYRYIRDCTIDAITSSTGKRIRCKSQAELCPSTQPDIPLRWPVTLKPEAEDRLNILLLRVGIVDVDADAATLLSADSVTIVLTLTFRATSKVSFELRMEYDEETKEMRPLFFERLDKPWILLTNLGLLAGATLAFYLWSNYLNVAVHSSDPFINSDILNLAIGFLLGFFGVQLGEIFLWARSVEILRSVLKYPEIYLARATVVSFRSPIILLLMTIVVCVMGAVAYAQRSVRTPESSREELRLVDHQGDEVKGDRIYVRDLESLRFVCEDAVGSRRAPTLETLRFKPLRDIRGWLYPLLGKAEVEPRPFRVEYPGWPGSDRGALVESFAGAEIFEVNVPFERSYLLAQVCEQPLARDGMEVEFFDASSTFRVIARRRLERDLLIFRLGRLSQRLDERSSSALLRDRGDLAQEFLSWFKTEEGGCEKDMFIALYGDILGNLAPTDLSSGLRRIRKAEALLSLYAERPITQLTTGDVEGLVEIYRADFIEGVPMRLHYKLVRAYWRLLLRIEGLYPLETDMIVHNAIADSLEGTGGEYYMYYLDEILQADLIELPDLDGVSKRRRSFFVDKATVIGNIEGVTGWLTRIASRSDAEEGKKFTLELRDALGALG